MSDGPERELTGYGRHVPRIEWPDGAKLALNVVVNYEEGSERSFLRDGRNEGLGETNRTVDPEYRDLGTESVYEYGSRAGIFRIMRVLEELGVPATYFAAAEALDLNPELCAWIRESPHEVAGHGYRWSEDWPLDRAEEARLLHAAVESIERTCGERPVGWYNRWMATPHTRELLAEEGGFLYDSNSYNDDLPYTTTVKGTPLLVMPYTLTYNDVRYVTGGLSPSGFVDTCIRGIDELVHEGETHPRMMSIGLHARWTGQAGRASAIREVLQHAQARGDVWIATRRDIASWWLEHAPSADGASS
jgi:peptidoglycan/xylan/chitin deacetylase (PgdA/CDA1 family)